MASARSVRRVVDEFGNDVPTAPYAYSGWHATVDKERVRAITRKSSGFTPAEKFMVLWFIGASPPGMDPVHRTGKDIAEEVGMTPDALARIMKKLARHRLIVETGKLGRIKLYRISPYIAFHGSGLEQREAVRDWNPPDIPGWTAPGPRGWEGQ
ncbi:MarR family transcriptional regulator [Streptomyces sp. 3R004]|nr:MarR family transcriptional regulator [Streptomyces justiciae]